MPIMIKCLPKEVQGKLRSGVAIPSLQQCVEELILNSIDAGATCVGVRMDMEAFKIQVIDNGAGMSAEDMDCVGNRYHTSKCTSVADLDNLRWYGFRGEALASLVSLATLVEISSRTRSSVKTHVKIFKEGKGLEVFEAEAARPSAGTTVIICNFFHNMPVRRKRVDAVLEGERIRHRVGAISLMHPSVSFTLKNDCTGAMMVQLPKARNTYHRFVQIHNLGQAEKLGEMNHTYKQFEVMGYIGREGHYNNSLQFLYVNERLLLKTHIHKLLNVLLRRLTSSNQKNDSPDWQSVFRSPKHKRSQDLYGVYIINIKCSYSEYDISLEPAKTLIEFKDWDGILLCVEEAVKAFLSRENLVAVITQDDLDYASPRVFGTDKTEPEENGDKGGQTAISISTMDCSVGTRLASESVHRNHTGDSVSKDGVCLEARLDKSEQPGQKKISTNEFQNVHSEKGLNNECSNELMSDLATVEPLPYKINKEVEPAYSEAGEGSNILHISRELLLKEGDDSLIQQAQPALKYTERIVPDCQDTSCHAQTLVSKRKIRLCDQYVQESLQTQDLLQNNRPVFQEESLTAKSEEKASVAKRKISLDTSRSSQKQCRDSSSVVPSKISKIISCHKLSGSLDKFRRTCVKSGDLESQLPKAHLKTDTPQTDHVFLNASIYQGAQQENKMQDKDDAQNSLQSPPTLSVFTKIKPESAQNQGKKSLAAKLRHLKQHGTDDSEVSLDFSRNVSKDTICVSTGIDSNQDSNEIPCDPEFNMRPALGCILNPELAMNEEDATSSDWLQHYDASVGKTVYVNRVTGLSRYEDPAMEETQVRCTSDVTNIAVSVISEMGDVGESSNSLFSLYSKWNNPVFVRPPMVGVDISSGQADGLAVKIHNVLFPYRFSKSMIHSMKVIHQVDKKFLACLISTKDDELVEHTETKGNLLVLVDQHAAHERVRLENLIAVIAVCAVTDSYEDDPDAPGERRLCTSTILPPLGISVTEEEIRMLRSCQPHLRSLGLEVHFSPAADLKVFVGKVPLCFMEKESNELRRGRPSVIKPIAEEYLREQIELLHSTGRVRGTLPLTVLKVLASLACHGAIKFNDTLSRDECYSLVASLSACQLPFQCAHGRPSIVPLVDVLHLDKDTEVQKPNLRKLRRMYKAWKLYGNT
ncbi:DNA mismatch repair protein Mlh3 isoform X3 [Oreochromis niloticus]|uniref:DNA mismatch repair protein Mlh3 isoform X3 n=1 Tax=Oreochromis niloticus TaxID=8128 RepID=UPI000674DEA9|nr:DNA mismatch repair protein Mlh3 isoform X3 [Oreochromis niloticus]